MNCPVCDEKLRAIERFGIEVDICPGCKGIWLDRGELEKVIAAVNGGTLPASAAPETPAEATDIPVAYTPPAAVATAPGPPPVEGGRRGHDHDDDDEDHYERRLPGAPRGPHEGSPRNRRGSWIADLLEGLGGGD